MKNIVLKTRRSLSLFLTILFLLAYTVSPIDIIPDVPPIGWIDDAIVIILGVAYIFFKNDKNGSYVEKIFKTAGLIVGLSITLLVLLIVLCIMLIINLLK